MSTKVMVHIFRIVICPFIHVPVVAREELDILYELFSAIADSNCKRLNRNQLVKAATNYVGEQVLDLLDMEGTPYMTSKFR